MPTARETARWIAWSVRDKLTYPRLLAHIRRESDRPAEDLEERRIDWGADPAQYALLIVPKAARATDRLVAFVYGGSWRRGSPDYYRFVGRAIARAGYPTAVLGYRLAPEHVFPAQRDDVLAGLAAVLGDAPDSGLSDEGAVVAGNSAGAHLAALAVYDRESRRRAGVADDALAGLLSVSGPLDLGLICEGYPCPAVATLMGRPDGWDEADPVLFVRGDEPYDVLAVHGRKDPMVTIGAAESFVRRVNEAAADAAGASGDGAATRARLVVAERGYHGDLIRALTGTSPEAAPTYAWLAEVLEARRPDDGPAARAGGVR
jgi:acetyl esterase/lipase